MSQERFQIKGAPTCRVVYPKGLFTKTLVKGAVDAPENYKYNALILIPKDDADKMAQLNEAYDKAFNELKTNPYFKGKTPASINPKNNCLEDGDKYADENDGKDAFRGYMILKVSSKTVRPLVADMQRRAIFNGHPIAGTPVEKISDEELADGDYIFANVSFWTYGQSGFQGIGANVHAIVRAAEGERIGGASGDVGDYIDTDYE